MRAWRLNFVCLSHVTRTPLSRSKGQRSTCMGRGHIVAACRTACYVRNNSSFMPFCSVWRVGDWKHSVATKMFCSGEDSDISAAADRCVWGVGCTMRVGVVGLWTRLQALVDPGGNPTIAPPHPVCHWDLLPTAGKEFNMC